MNQLSKNLKERRKALNFTQQDIAVELHVSNKAVSKWETGECLPDTSQLFPLAKLLGMTVDDLLGGNGDGQKNKTFEQDVSGKIAIAENEKKPWRKFLFCALCSAVIGILVFFLFLIVFRNGYATTDLWALGILFTFSGLSVIFLLSALVVYLVSCK